MPKENLKGKLLSQDATLKVMMPTVTNPESELGLVQNEERLFENTNEKLMRRYVE